MKSGTLVVAPIDEMSKDPHKKAERAALLKGRQVNYPAKVESGYTPVTWCAGRLPSKVRVVRPEELFWRIRMGHDADATRRWIAAWPR